MTFGQFAHAMALRLVIVLVLILLLAGCAIERAIERDYQACKDPKSYITWTPRQCHASFRPEDDR